MSVFRKIEGHLESIHENEEFNVEQFLTLEKELPVEVPKDELDRGLLKKLEHLIEQIEQNSATQTVLGAYQAAFFGFLRKIKGSIGNGESDEVKKVSRVELDCLDKK